MNTKCCNQIQMAFILWPQIFTESEKKWPMYSGKIVFSQFTEFLPFYQFRKCVALYNGNDYVKKFHLYGSIFVYGVRSIDLS
jgi:hypothetical protein